MVHLMILLLQWPENMCVPVLGPLSQMFCYSNNNKKKNCRKVIEINIPFCFSNNFLVCECTSVFNCFVSFDLVCPSAKCLHRKIAYYLSKKLAKCLTWQKSVKQIKRPQRKYFNKFGKNISRFLYKYVIQSTNIE